MPSSRSTFICTWSEDSQTCQITLHDYIDEFRIQYRRHPTEVKKGSWWRELRRQSSVKDSYIFCSPYEVRASGTSGHIWVGNEQTLVTTFPALVGLFNPPSERMKVALKAARDRQVLVETSCDPSASLVDNTWETQRHREALTRSTWRVGSGIFSELRKQDPEARRLHAATRRNGEDTLDEQQIVSSQRESLGTESPFSRGDVATLCDSGCGAMIGRGREQLTTSESEEGRTEPCP